MTTVYEYPQRRSDVLTASGETMSRMDAMALGYVVAPYSDLVARSERIATQHPEHFDLAVLPPFGLTVTSDTAKAMGFTLTQSKAPPRVASTLDPRSAWRASVSHLSEALERPAATAELLTSRTPETLSVDAARAFLRGLPVETEHTEQTEDTMTTDPRAERLAEIERSMNAFNRNNGHAGKDLRADIKDIDPARLRRLAEIKLNAMNSNERSMTSEFRSLKLALDVHSRMGGDFSRVLAENGVSVESLRPKIA